MSIPPELMQWLRSGRPPVGGVGMGVGLSLDGRDNSHAASALTLQPGLHQYEDGSEEFTLDPHTPGGSRSNAIPLAPLSVVAERSRLSPLSMPKMPQPHKETSEETTARLREELQARLREEPWWSIDAAADVTGEGQMVRRGPARDYGTLAPQWAAPPWAEPSNELPPVYARPPASWNGNAFGINAGRSANVEDRRGEDGGAHRSILDILLKRNRGDDEAAQWMANPSNMRPPQ